MSVSSEFQRVLADLVAQLGHSEAEATFAAALADAGTRGRKDLSDGAARVVGLLERRGAAAAANLELDSDELQERMRHLRAICRAILGR